MRKKGESDGSMIVQPMLINNLKMIDKGYNYFSKFLLFLCIASTIIQLQLDWIQKWVGILQQSHGIHQAWHNISLKGGLSRKAAWWLVLSVEMKWLMGGGGMVNLKESNIFVELCQSVLKCIVGGGHDHLHVAMLYWEFPGMLLCYM